MEKHLTIDWDALQAAVDRQFRGDSFGIHGTRHWRQVERNGLQLAKANGLTEGQIVVVRLFGWTHDSQRVNDGWDQGHGKRAAEYVREQNGRLFTLSDWDLEILAQACAGHELGYTSEDVVIGTCWDADRLDLVRVGAMPVKRYMSTEGGRELAV